MTLEITMHNATIVALDRALGGLEHFLKIGEANAEERGIEASVFLTARLAPDMATLTKQVQIAASMVKMLPYRLTKNEPPVYDDMETTFAELYDLIAKARKDLNSFSEDEINATAANTFTVKLGPNDQAFNGLAYATGFVLPNVYFHITTAYNILRHNGVPIGKRDFFGGSL